MYILKVSTLLKTYELMKARSSKSFKVYSPSINEAINLIETLLFLQGKNRTYLVSQNNVDCNINYSTLKDSNVADIIENGIIYYII